MALAIDTATMLPNGNVRTPRGRFLYPSLFQKSLPRGEQDKSKAAYQVTLLIPKEADISALKKAIAEAVEENVPAKARATTKIRNPLLKTADQPRFAEYADDYPIMLRFNSKKMRPDVVNPKGDANISEDQEADEVYSGRWGRVTCRVFFYSHDTGGKGVSLGLQNTQVLLGPDGEPGESMAGGKAKGTSEFEAADDADLKAMDLDDEIPF